MSRISLFALTFALVAWASAEPKLYDIKNAAQLFLQFQKDYHRVYKDGADKTLHYQAFIENLKSINEKNEKNPQAVFGIDEMADYTAEDFKKKTGFKPIGATPSALLGI